MQVGNEAPFEARAQPLAESGYFPGQAVACDGDLTVISVQLVKGIEEVLLGTFLAAEELDIINQQHINTAVLVAEFPCPVFTDSADQLVGELLGANVEYFKSASYRGMPDSM